MYETWRSAKWERVKLHVKWNYEGKHPDAETAMFYTYCYKLAIFKLKIKDMNNKLNGFNDGLHPSSGIGGGKSASKLMQETTQLSGLSDYELELEKIVDKIKTEPSTLRCIQLLKKLVGDFGD